MNRKALVQKLEKHLFSYRQYHVAIRNLQKQLDYIMPGLTANYEVAEGSTGTFNIKSSTENAAIDRIESRRALNLHEDKRRLEIIVSCIDESVNFLEEPERAFIKARYFEGLKIEDVARRLDYSAPYVYKIRDQVMKKLLVSLANIIDL